MFTRQNHLYVWLTFWGISRDLCVRLGRKWGEALPSRTEFRNPRCPKGLRNPNNGGTIFVPLSRLCIDSSSNPAKIRSLRNINFVYLASYVLLLLSVVDLLPRSAQILVNFRRKSRFLKVGRSPPLQQGFPESGVPKGTPEPK